MAAAAAAKFYHFSPFSAASAEGADIAGVDILSNNIILTVVEDLYT